MILVLVVSNIVKVGDFKKKWYFSQEAVDIQIYIGFIGASRRFILFFKISG